MDRLTATDALFAYAETRATPMNMGTVQILRPAPGFKGDYFKALKTFLAERLEYLPKLKKKLVVNKMGLPCWEDVAEVDLDYHIRRTRLRSGGEHELAEKLGRLQHIPFDFEKPLFMFYLIEGLADGRLILLQKFHHTIADGKTAVLIMDLFSDEGLERARKALHLGGEPSRSAGTVRRSLGGLVEDAGRTWRSLPGLVGAGRRLLSRDGRTMMGRLASRPITIFNRPLSEKRLFAYRSWPLPKLQRIRKAAGLTFNDMGLLLLGGALRRYLDEMDALPDKSLICTVPVALDVPGLASGNSVVSMWVPLGTEIADPAERAASIKKEAGDAKRFLQDVLQGSAMGKGIQLPSSMVRAMALSLTSRRLAQLSPPPACVAMSNVPAPGAPIHVAGALVEALYGMPMLLQGQTIGSTFTSYADQVVAGMICCGEAVPDPERILQYMDDELQALDRLFPRLPAGTGQKRPARRRAKT